MYSTPATVYRGPIQQRPLPLRAGTRGSLLALWQTRAFLRALEDICPPLRAPGALAECVIGVTGDAIQDRPLAEIGGKALFAKEIHEALLAGRIDVAVHSLKDLDTDLPEGVTIACLLRREDARDAMVLGAEWQSAASRGLAALPEGAVVGTCSVRRQAQLLYARPDLRIVPMRGNVQTRLRKVGAGDCAGTLLALAGLRRLGLEQHAHIVFDPEEMLPAAGQGIIAVTVRSDDESLLTMLDAMADPEAKAACRAERALLAVLDGTCSTPIGSHARLLPGGMLRLTGLIASPDGTFMARRSLEGPAEDATRLGVELGMELRGEAPASLLASLFENSRPKALAAGRALIAAE
jgi:hydroxymethylbilane synthase